MYFKKISLQKLWIFVAMWVNINLWLIQRQKTEVILCG